MFDLIWLVWFIWSFNSISFEKVFSFANESLRRAANAIFRATARLNDEISFDDILEALEDVGPSRNVDFETSKVTNVEFETTKVITIPTLVDGVESMATTCSSLDSNAFLKSESEHSLNLIEDVTEEEEDHDEVELGPKALPIITMEEVGEHYTQNDSWMVIYDKVYDFTDFMFQVSSF